jgi:aminoglycoside phosphotransferase (APT) family kinase protein
MHDLADLSDRLAKLLSASGDLGDDVEVTDVVQMTGGYSLRMYRFEAKGGRGMGRYVLRANPPADEALSNTDRSLEWSLLDALTRSSDVPMPAARWADLDGSTLGTPAFVVDLVDGPQLLAHLNAVDEAAQRTLALDLATTIGAVHNAGAAVVPPAFERPSSWDEYIDGHIALWRATEASLAERDPFIRWLARWLETHKPPPAPLTLVHGEFQTANVVVGSEGMQVVDWEYAHVGDPRADLGWIQNVAAFSPPDPVALDPVAFCERYCTVTGLGPEIVNPLTVGYFAILGGAKALAGMLHGVTALAAGENHGMTNAYLVSALPFSHDLWRQGIAGIDAAMAMLAEQAGGAAR